MECSKKLRVKRYLERFDEILCTMKHKMLCAKFNGDLTKYFIECMIPHHQAAIYMCENLLQYTKYESLILIANNIIKMQTKGIEQMKEIFCDTKGYENTENEIKCYIEKYCDIVNQMVYRMKNSPKGININLNFINEMIPHHEGAIYMCKNVLKYNIDPRLKQIAESIINEQEHGVKEMEMLIGKLS